MCKSFSINWLFILLIGAFVGCNSADKTQEATNSPLQTNAANAASQPQHQYMAVCMTKEEHDGNEYILTKWLDSKNKALMYGREHSRKRKGHNVVYKERVKP